MCVVVLLFAWNTIIALDSSPFDGKCLFFSVCPALFGLKPSPKKPSPEEVLLEDGDWSDLSLDPEELGEDAFEYEYEYFTPEEAAAVEKQTAAADGWEIVDPALQRPQLIHGHTRTEETEGSAEGGKPAAETWSYLDQDSAEDGAEDSLPLADLFQTSAAQGIQTPHHQKPKHSRHPSQTSQGDEMDIVTAQDEMGWFSPSQLTFTPKSTARLMGTDTSADHRRGPLKRKLKTTEEGLVEGKSMDFFGKQSLRRQTCPPGQLQALLDSAGMLSTADDWIQDLIRHHHRSFI